MPMGLGWFTSSQMCVEPGVTVSAAVTSDISKTRPSISQFMRIITSGTVRTGADGSARNRWVDSVAGTATRGPCVADTRSVINVSGAPWGTGDVSSIMPTRPTACDGKAMELSWTVDPGACEDRSSITSARWPGARVSAGCVRARSSSPPSPPITVIAVPSLHTSL